MSATTSTSGPAATSTVSIRSHAAAPAPDSNACAMRNLGERALDLIDLPGRTERLPDERSRGIQGMAWD